MGRGANGRTMADRIGATTMARAVARTGASRVTQELQDGAEGQNRTADTTIFSRMLYQLSYLGTRWGPTDKARVYHALPPVTQSPRPAPSSAPATTSSG